MVHKEFQSIIQNQRENGSNDWETFWVLHSNAALFILIILLCLVTLLIQFYSAYSSLLRLFIRRNVTLKQPENGPIKCPFKQLINEDLSPTWGYIYHLLYLHLFFCVDGSNQDSSRNHKYFSKPLRSPDCLNHIDHSKGPWFWSADHFSIRIVFD